jgi:hypothetical protein
MRDSLFGLHSVSGMIHTETNSGPKTVRETEQNGASSGAYLIQLFRIVSMSYIALGVLGLHHLSGSRM